MALDEPQAFVGSSYRRHVFVCLNDRSCRPRGSGAIFRILQEGVAKAGLRDVSVMPARCLDLCPYGPTVIMYPGAITYHVPTVDDAKEILASDVIGGKIVERLLMEHFR